MLLGSTFATGPQIELNARSIPNDGWEAVILVTGDVERVLTEYIEQGRRLGIPIGPLRCDEPRSSGEAESCEFSGSVGKAGRSRGLRGDFARWPVTPISHLFLTYSEPRHRSRRPTRTLRGVGRSAAPIPEVLAAAPAPR